MPIDSPKPESPKLDKRTFQDLVDDAKLRSSRGARSGPTTTWVTRE